MICFQISINIEKNENIEIFMRVLKAHARADAKLRPDFPWPYLCSLHFVTFIIVLGRSHDRVWSEKMPISILHIMYTTTNDKNTISKNCPPKT